MLKKINIYGYYNSLHIDIDLAVSNCVHYLGSNWK